MKYGIECLSSMWSGCQSRVMIVSCYVDGTHEGKIGTHGEGVLHHLSWDAHDTRYVERVQ